MNWHWPKKIKANCLPSLEGPSAQELNMGPDRDNMFKSFNGLIIFHLTIYANFDR